MTSTDPSPVNLLLIIIVNGLQAEKLMKHLSQEKFYFTKIDSSGGFLHEPVLCLLVGLNHARLDELTGLLQQDCQPYRQYIPTQMSLPTDYTQIPMIEARMGGAVVCSMNLERFIQV